MTISKRLKVLILCIVTIVILILWVEVSKPVIPYGVDGFTEEADRVFELALQNNDISICDKVHLVSFADTTTAELQAGCYEVYVKAHPDQNVCPRISNNFRCVDAQATTLENPRVCFSLQDSDYKALCVSNVAVKNHDLNICKVLSNSDEFEKCKQHFLSN